MYHESVPLFLCMLPVHIYIACHCVRTSVSCSGFNISEMQVILNGGAVDNTQIAMQLDSQTQYLTYGIPAVSMATRCLIARTCVHSHRPSTLYYFYQSPVIPIDGQWHPGFMSYQVSPCVLTTCVCVCATWSMCVCVCVL